MPSQLKVALLEDNPHQLKERINDIRDADLASIVAFATNSTEFLAKIEANPPDVLFMDIDLQGDNTSGIELAYQLKRPVLFLSGKNHEHLKDIEKLKREFDVPVDHMTKPIVTEDFVVHARKFLAEVKLYIRRTSVTLRFKGSGNESVGTDSIVYMESCEGDEGKSNNKRIYFNNRPPEILADFSFSKMDGLGLDPTVFITTHQSYRVNVNKLKLASNGETVSVYVMDEDQKMLKKTIPVSTNYRSSTKKSADTKYR